MDNRPTGYWQGALGWLSDRPGGAALAATLLVAVFAALIRPPIIEASMIDEISGSNAQLERARRIEAAAGALATAAVIVTPQDVTIAALFADLARLREQLIAIDRDVTLRSVDAARDQLFLYDLTVDAPARQLLHALAGHPESGAIISADASRFLYALTFPERIEDRVLDTLLAHSWSETYSEHRILAGAQLERDIAAALQRDLALLIPAIVVSMLLALILAFLRWRAVFLPVFASVASTIVTLALFSVTGTAINLVTLLVLPIVLIVGLANSCHFLAQCAAEVEVAPEPSQAVRATLQRVGPPFFFSSITTAIALASLSLNDVPPIAALGRVASSTLVVVLVLVLLAAPLSLRWYLAGPSRRWRSPGLFAALSRRLAAWRVPLSAVLLAATLGGAAAVPFLSVQSNPRAFFPDDSAFSSAQRAFEREFYAFTPLQGLLSATAGPGAQRQAFEHSGALRDALAGHPGVRHVDIRPAATDDPAFVFSVLLDGDDELPGVVALLETQRATLPENVALLYTSASLVYGDIDRQAMSSLLQSLGWSVALICGAMLLVFRSLATVVAAMLANVVPLLVVCGAIWLIDRPLNLVSVFVFLFALGVVVDDAIHILFARAAGDRLTGSSIEFSVLLSTAMLCLGLVLCQLSDFPTTREFAAYCALALVGAVISNLTLLPAALRWLGRRRLASDVEVGDG